MTQVPHGPQRPVAPPVSPEGAGAPERQPQGQPAPATPPHGLPDDLHNALSLVIYKAGIPLSAASAAAEAIAARPTLLDALVAYRQRSIVTVDDLEALPDRTVIRTCYGTAAQKSDETWEFPNEVGLWHSAAIDLPATVLWSPVDATERSTDG